MILGIGTDIVEISRIKKAVEGSSFCDRFFTQLENDYFSSKNNKYQTIAGNFCSKEAFSKALGTGVRNFSLKDIEVLCDNLGKPYINVHGNAKNIIEKANATIHVSISHTKEYAISYVILETKGER